MAPRDVQQRMEKLRTHIKESGLKWTDQRELILQTFLEGKNHSSAEDIFRRVRQKNSAVGFATVYRTLKIFIDSGICKGKCFRGKGGEIRYDYEYSSKEHEHMVCENCGDIIEFTSRGIEKLQQEIIKRHNFIAISHRLDIFGLCAKCANHHQGPRHV